MSTRGFGWKDDYKFGDKLSAATFNAFEDNIDAALQALTQLVSATGVLKSTHCNGSNGGGLILVVSEGFVVVGTTDDYVPRYVAVQNVVLTASKDNYVDCLEDGTISVTAVTLGAGAPAIPTGAARLLKVVTGASTITTITQNPTGRVNLVGSLILGVSTDQTMAGKLVLGADPTVALGAATKQYVDNGDLGTVTISPASSARNTIQPTGDFIPLLLKGNASQTVSLTEWRNSGSTILARIENDGNLVLSPVAFSHASGTESVVTATGTHNTTAAGSGSFQGISSDITINATGASGPSSGSFVSSVFTIRVTNVTAGNTVNASNLSSVRVHALAGAGMAGTVNLMHALHVDIWGLSANPDGVVTNLYGLRIAAPSTTSTGTGSVTNVYGINIANVAGATSLNYAIYTGTGNIRFGDGVAIGTAATTPTSYLDVTSSDTARVVSILKMAASQAANALEIKNSSNTVRFSVDANGGISVLPGTITHASGTVIHNTYTCTYALPATGTGSVFGVSHTLAASATGASAPTSGSVVGAAFSTSVGAVTAGFTVNTTLTTLQIRQNISTSMAGTWGAAQAIYLDSWGIGATTPGTVTSLAGIRIGGPSLTSSGGGGVTRAYGILLGDISGATSLNYAIYTGTGAVRFGDAVGIGISTLTLPNANAILELSSTAKGLLLTRLTTTQRDAVGSWVAGMLIYNTTLSKLQIYTGAAWETVTSV